MAARRARRRPQRRGALPEEGTRGEEGRRGGAHLIARVGERRAGDGDGVEGVGDGDGVDGGRRRRSGRRRRGSGAATATSVWLRATARCGRGFARAC
jgi:hypothetical protein